MQTIHETIEGLHEALVEYIEATYHISNPYLIDQRRDLLDKVGVVHQIPYLESTPRYASGNTFETINDLPSAALDIFSRLSKSDGDLPRLIYNPPYRHQSDSVRNALIEEKNLVIMTGTGSGKTEAFLLPILGKLAKEAKGTPKSFAQQSGIRALILYPMNALVNDQLGRLRSLFGDPRVVAQFKAWAGRPPRFARYTSRTPYAGIRQSKKDSSKLAGFEKFYISLLEQDEEGINEAHHLLEQLKKRGKWPAKPDLAAWFGPKGSHWKNSRTGQFVRAVTLQDDSELLTRHEVQASPPDLLVTNYSMLEYMLVRPLERPIFDATRAWLAQNPAEKFLLVLDEAHLYRGAAGAEVGLLIRRLRDRLDIPHERFQVICATASFKDSNYAPKFGAQISGISDKTFVPIVGELDLLPNGAPGTDSDAETLGSIDLSDYYRAENDNARLEIIQPLLRYRNISDEGSAETSLYAALWDFGPMRLLINETMKAASPLTELSQKIFPIDDSSQADVALTTLMALGSVARAEPNGPGLLPCRVHNFFRGLPGLWVCMDPHCSEIQDKHRNDICGKMYSQPMEFCACGSRALELFTCRNCGTAYARAYTDNIDTPNTLWSEPGHQLRVAGHQTNPLQSLDLLLEKPKNEELVELADYDLETSQLNPENLGTRIRSVYLRSNRVIDIPDEVEEDGDTADGSTTRGEFTSCAICEKSSSFGRSNVQDHQTKGDQPFQALVSKQILIQPPGPVQSTDFAPLRGRKVLTFSDSRQVAARLAPNLQNYSMRDSLRSLILYGFNHLQTVTSFRQQISLEDLYLAVLIASHKLHVRLRPELKSGESFASAYERAGSIIEDIESDLQNVMAIANFRLEESPPESLLENILWVVQDRFLGLEPLALASIVERNEHTAKLGTLPDIPGMAETEQAKRELARAWLRCWQSNGFRINSMPDSWIGRSRSEGISVQAHKGKFKSMNVILKERPAQKLFDRDWLPVLLGIFTTTSNGDKRQLQGNNLSLDLSSNWVRCLDCKSVHRPVSGLSYCLDCGSKNVNTLQPDSDRVFLARKGYYRKPAVASLAEPPRGPMVFIAAEHTGQLNAPQSEDTFSVAEENELLFQDVELKQIHQGRQAAAIDILSSTTTMEVGIDLGALSGVAMRNMPPTRANYQQRAGRAGRRGNAIATVVAFGSADTHDEHYFSEPDSMIRGDVIDPMLTLDNKEIVRRHIRAFLLQNYHQDRLPGVDENQPHDLFSVLGTVSEFKSKNGLLNRYDFMSWLEEKEVHLQERIMSWIPSELSSEEKSELLDTMKDDCTSAIDEAIHYQSLNEERVDDSDADESEDTSQTNKEHHSKLNTNKLLDRLLYYGKLPRYAFPTDVAAFHVFNRHRSSSYKPVMLFAPQQGLPIALTQYAPGKQVWIAGKCYTSGAIYSPIRNDRRSAWESRQYYLECSECGFAKIFDTDEVELGESRNCIACDSEDTFGPARNWIRPPGFAHPIDEEEVTSPDGIPETSYATRAKLTMETPSDKKRWISVNDRILALGTRQHLLVSNTGPQNKGYDYCIKCGLIDAHANSNKFLRSTHEKPFPSDGDKCDGDRTIRHLILGTDFITDIALFSLQVQPPLRLRPGDYSTDVALRTLSEALSEAACQLLEIEPSELMAEYRPALTKHGKEGLEAEVFFYDTLPGGAGFSSQLTLCGDELFSRALDLMKACPEDCDVSCYRCLRSFKNKFEHALLDRHVGIELLEYLITGSRPSFNKRRLDTAKKLLINDIRRSSGHLIIDEDVDISTPDSRSIKAPIHITQADGAISAIIISNPLEENYPSSTNTQAEQHSSNGIRLIHINELLIRRNLAEATKRVLREVNFQHSPEH